jgi:hypothetical protein
LTLGEGMKLDKRLLGTLLVVLLGVIGGIKVLGGEQPSPVVIPSGSFANYIEGLSLKPLKETSSTLDLGTVLQIDLNGQSIFAKPDIAFEDSKSFQDAKWIELIDEAVYRDQLSVAGKVSTLNLPGIDSLANASTSGTSKASLYTRVVGLEKKELTTTELRNAKLRQGISSELNETPGIFVVRKVLRAKKLQYVYRNESSVLTEAEIAGWASGEFSADGSSSGRVLLESKIIAVQPAYVFGGSSVTNEDANLVAAELEKTGIEASVDGGVVIASVGTENALLVNGIAAATLEKERASRLAVTLGSENQKLERDVGELKEMMRASLPAVRKAYEIDIQRDLDLLNSKLKDRPGETRPISREHFLREEAGWRREFTNRPSPVDSEARKLMDQVNGRIKGLQEFERAIEKL